MCLNPITIRNPRTFYRHGIDKILLTVPCNKCTECKNELTNDWFVRLAYEYYDTIRSGGAFYFPTLTYNDDSRPVLDTTLPEFQCLNDVHGRYVPGVTPTVPQFVQYGFNKSHAQKFFKSLRQNFNSPYLPEDLRLHIPSGVKYFLVSEYGGETHKPHYHVLLSLPKEVDSYALKKVLEISWSDRIAFSDAPYYVQTLATKHYPYVEKLAHGQYVELERYFILPPRRGQKTPQIFHRKGFVSWSKKHGPKVQSVACVRYILKYLFKDSQFMCRPLVSLLDDYIQSLPPIKTITNDVQLALIKKLKDFFPFRLSSQKLGDSLFRQLDLKNLSEDETYSALDKLQNNQVSVPNDTVLYSIPKYIVRRLFYNYRDIGLKKNVCQLDSVGAQVLRMKYNYTVDYLAKRYSFLQSDSFINMADSTFFDEFRFKYGLSYDQFHSFVTEKFSGMFEDFHDLAIYNLVFRDVSYDGVDVSDLTLKDLTSNGINIFNQKIDTYNNPDEDYYYNLPDPLNKLDTREFNYLRRNLYNALPQFDKYQFVVDAFEFIFQKVMYRVIQEKEQQKAYRDAMHQLYTNFMYN